MSLSDTIKRAALGRPFQLGMLYDCRTDVLIPGITLWDADMLQRKINVKPQHDTDFKIISSDSTEDKAHALEVNASLEASFLCGLVSVKGSAEFLNDKKKSKHQSRVTLQYRTSTRFEQITTDHLGQGNVQHCDVFSHGSATHVVTAILYGAQAFFVFDREVSANENHQSIQGSLQATITRIPLVSIAGHVKLQMIESEKIGCTFHGDFALASNPVNFQEALDVYSQLPQLLGPNGENAVPRTVWLYPLNKLDSTAAQLVREISIGLVHQAQCILSEMDETKIHCEDLMKDDIAIDFSEIATKLQKFRSLVSEFRQVFQKKLCGLLPVFRGGGSTEQELIKALSSKHTSPFKSTLLTEYLSDRECEMNVVRSYLKTMGGVKVVTSSAGLDKVVLNSKNDFVVAFVLSSLSGNSEYLQALEDYLAGVSTGSDTIYEDKSAAREGQWFRSGKVISFAKQSIRLFLDFMQANEDRENIEFYIASVQNKSIAAASIHVYEKGTLLHSQFSLPSCPPTPKVVSLEHNCVHLHIDPPGFGQDSVLSYCVLYQTSKESDWKEITTDGKVTSLTVSHLEPHTEYRFRCKAVCRPGVSLPSDATKCVKTHPCSPPGVPREKVLEPESITVTWDIPTNFGDDVNVIKYDIEYRQHENGDSKSKPWKCVEATARECTLHGLRSNTSYSIRVLANTGKSGKSLPSPEAQISTPAKTKSEPFLRQSNWLKKTDNPAVHLLSLHKKYGEDDDFSQYVFGRKEGKQEHKVILVMGATGVGKTSLINMMTNYILGVEWEEKHRFKLINELTNQSQAASQTSRVTSYELYSQPGFQIPYSLTIIDTPGFGDTRGKDHDKLITEQVKRFLCSPLGVDQIHAVCFVLKASDARLTDSQSYIFDSVLSIFGKDIGDNIMILLTFDDGAEPQALEAIKAANFPCKKEDNIPTHFLLNNSALYVQKKPKASGGGESTYDQRNRLNWSQTFEQCESFFTCLQDIKGKDLTMTKNVLEQREHLEKITTEMSSQIKAGVTKLSQISKIKQCVKNERKIMSENENFETIIPVQKAKRRHTKDFATNCYQCLFTCHSKCYLPDDDPLEGCAAMDDHGYCLACPNHCSNTEHVQEKAVWEYEETYENQTIQAIKDNFMKANKEVNTKTEMLTRLKEEYSTITTALVKLIKQTSDSINRINKFALKASSMTPFDYIESIIQREVKEKLPGFEDRIKACEKLKINAVILQ